MATNRSRVLFLVVFSVHLAATAFCSVKSFGLSMDRFDSGEPISEYESVLDAVLTVLSFPILELAQRIDPLFLPGLAGWLPFIANSAAWASMAVLLQYVYFHASAQPRRHAG